MAKYSENEEKILSYFYTNAESDTYFLKNFPDFEVAGLFVASYSRNKYILKDMFLNTLIDLDVVEPHNKEIKKQIKSEKKRLKGTSILKNRVKELKEQIWPKAEEFRELRPDLVEDCFKKWADKISELKSGSFQDFIDLLGPKARGLFGIWADKYGHDSLKDMAHGLGFACENITNIFSVILEDHPLGDYQEKSSRYIKFSEDEVLMPEEFRGTDFEDRINENTKLVMSTYEDLLPKVINYLFETRDKPEDFKKVAWENAVKAYAFDNVRYLLPSRVRTNVGQISNTRTLQSQISEMLISPLIEVRKKGEEILREGRKVFPTLLLNTPPNTYMEKTTEKMIEVTNSLEDKIKNCEEIDSNYIKLVDYTPDIENKLIASMLYEYSSAQKSWELWYNYVKDKMTQEEKEDVVEEFFKERTQGYPRIDAVSGEEEIRDYIFTPLKAIRDCYLKFDLLIDYGAFRDVHRHRRCSQRRQYLTAELGYEIPRVIKEMGGEVEEKYIKAMEDTAALYKKVKKSGQFHPAALQYLTSFAFRISETISFDAEELFYICELRTKPGCHFAYKTLVEDMYKQCEQILPIISKYIKVDLNDYEFGRLKQEQRYFDKLEKRGIEEKDGISAD